MVKQLTPSETRAQIDAKVDRSPLLAFAYLDVDRRIHYDWHAHERHQLIYAFSGTLRLEAEKGVYLLPPQRAAWIPAGVSHRTTLRNVLSGSVFFAPALVAEPQTEIRIIAAAPLLREMVQYALRWPPDRAPTEPVAASFFATLALLCEEWIRRETPFRLPAAQSARIGAAMAYTREELERGTLSGAARAAALSPRQFRRIFQAETGIGWRQYQQQARMLRAMELLVTPQARVTEVAYAVGFNSLSAFAKCFAAFSGQTPTDFRRSGVQTLPAPPD